VTGGGSYVSGAVPEGIDAAFDAAKYSTASEVHLASVGGTTSTHMLTRSKLDVDYVPLGSSPVGQYAHEGTNVARLARRKYAWVVFLL